MLGRAIVVKTVWAVAGFSHDFGAPVRRWLVRTAGEGAFLESQVVEHLLHQCDVLGLAAVRCAGHCQLFVAPAQRIEAAGAEKGDYLERLGAGAPVGEGV